MLLGGKLKRSIRNMRIGIIRGTNSRLTQAEFSASFKKLRPVFITGEASQEIKTYCQKKKLAHRDLPLKPLWKIDPVKLILGRQTHQSWTGQTGLAEACQDLDVLETQELLFPFSGQAVKIAKAFKIPLICEVWISFAKHPGYFIPPYSFITKKVKDTASLFIARSRRTAKALKELGIAEKKIKTIYHGVNLKRFKQGKKFFKKDKIKILFVGTLEFYKGVDLLLDIWPDLFKANKNIELWLVGKGSLLKQAKAIKGVKVFGYVHHLKIPNIYQQADIFVFPSREKYLGPFLWGEEFFSYVLMEAQASGLPIVTTRCGGIPEEVGKNNFLIEQKDKEGLYRALERLIKNRDLRLEIGRANRKRAERLFNLEKQTANLEKEILKLLNLNGR